MAKFGAVGKAVVTVPVEVPIRKGAIRLDAGDTLDITADDGTGNAPSMLVLMDGAYHEVVLPRGSKWAMLEQRDLAGRVRR